MYDVNTSKSRFDLPCGKEHNNSSKVFFFTKRTSEYIEQLNFT